MRSRKAPEIAQDAVGYAAGLYGALRAKAATADQKKVSVPVTVRTLETLIRLATAHAKLRLATHVESSDMDLAGKLLNMTIFREPIEEEEEEAAEDQEMEAVAEVGQAAGKENLVPLKQKASRAMRSRRRDEVKAASKGAGDDDDEEELLDSNVSSKRARIDH